MMETFLSVDQPAESSTSSLEGPLLVPRASSNLDELRYLEGRSIDLINQTALKATRLAHSAGGVPCLEIRTPDLSLNNLGALLAFFETACAVGGLLLNVNPFNQPGVEAYKLKMFELLGKPSK